LARKPRREKLTVSLLKEELGRDDALRDRDALTGYRVPGIDKRRHSLFAASKPPHPPPWAKYLSPHVSGDLAGLNTSSAAAVLLLEAAGRIVPKGADRAVLLDAKPQADLLVLLDSQGIAAIWRNGESFVDNAGGRFV